MDISGKQLRRHMNRHWRKHMALQMRLNKRSRKRLVLVWLTRSRLVGQVVRGALAEILLTFKREDEVDKWV